LVFVVAAAFAAGVGDVVVEEETPLACAPLALTGVIGVVVEVPADVAAGSQGAPPAVFGAAGFDAAAAAAFFLPKSDPKLETAAAAFETAALAPVAV
jgi:hypothetical protein